MSVAEEDRGVFLPSLYYFSMMQRHTCTYFLPNLTRDFYVLSLDALVMKQLGIRYIQFAPAWLDGRRDVTCMYPLP